MRLFVLGMFVVLVLSHLLEGVCAHLFCCVPWALNGGVLKSRVLSRSLFRLTPIVEDECEEGVYLLMLLAVHFAVMVTFSCPLCTRSSKPNTTAQNNRIIECVLVFLGVCVAGESMALTPPPF